MSDAQWKAVSQATGHRIKRYVKGGAVCEVTFKKAKAILEQAEAGEEQAAAPPVPQQSTQDKLNRMRNTNYKISC